MKKKREKSIPPKKRGGARPGAGRPKGVPNKVTAEARVALKMLIDNLTGELEAWIRKGAAKKPLEAAKVVAQLAEFCVPKLSRSEHIVPPGSAPLIGATTNVTISEKDAAEAYRRMLKRPK